LPFDEAAAHGVVLERVEGLVPRQELARHRVGMREVALGLVEDDVLQRRVERGAAELHRERLIGLRRELVGERRIDRRRLLADDPGERGTLGAVSLARGAQAAEEAYAERGRL